MKVLLKIIQTSDYRNTRAGDVIHQFITQLKTIQSSTVIAPGKGLSLFANLLVPSLYDSCFALKGATIIWTLKKQTNHHITEDYFLMIAGI